jgi:ATP-dependent Clp protease adaptor protein ClpS
MAKSKPTEQDGILTAEETRVKEPPLFRVILLNDNYTTMEFVMQVLEAIFHKPPLEAQQIMLRVHEKGSGIAGVYTREVAETKVATVHLLARQHEFPLKCAMEPD